MKAPKQQERGATMRSAGLKRPLKAISSAGAPQTQLRYRGCTTFRARIVFSLLSGRPLRIDDIRPTLTENTSEVVNVGLVDFEASFLRLVDKLTNGTHVEINETGTTLRLKPGFVVGGSVEHDCGTGRSIGWFLEGIIPLALFSKKAFHLTLTGVTNNSEDVSVDAIKAVTLPLLQRFGVGEEGGLDLQIKRRGAPPGGGGSVEFKCPLVRQLHPVDLTDPGMIKRIRGNAYCTKVSPQMANRVAESSRALLNRLLPDVWVHTEHSGGAKGGNSPGFAVTLVAESNNGCLLSAEVAAEGATLPEDLGQRASQLLLEEVHRGGCVDSTHQALACTLMALCPEDVSRVRIGKLGPHAIKILRLLRDVFGVVFKLKADHETSTVVLSCLGAGYKNMSRGAT